MSFLVSGTKFGKILNAGQAIKFCFFDIFHMVVILIILSLHKWALPHVRWMKMKTKHADVSFDHSTCIPIKSQQKRRNDRDPEVDTRQAGASNYNVSSAIH